jgi:hypothetical protein
VERISALAEVNRNAGFIHHFETDRVFRFCRFSKSERVVYNFFFNYHLLCFCNLKSILFIIKSLLHLNSTKMKTLFLMLFTSVFCVNVMAQNTIVGTYNQDAFIAPDNLKDAENDLVITKDPASTKKIWLSNLVSNTRIYAVAFVSNEDGVIYKIPPQVIGNYKIEGGCISYDFEDAKITIAINNKDLCYGMSQSDYDKGVSIDKKGGVKAGDNQVNSGGVKGAGVDIKSDGSINVDTKKTMAGVQYVGHKAGKDDN